MGIVFLIWIILIIFQEPILNYITKVQQRWADYDRIDELQRKQEQEAEKHNNDDFQ